MKTSKLTALAAALAAALLLNASRGAAQDDPAPAAPAASPAASAAASPAASAAASATPAAPNAGKGDRQQQFRQMMTDRLKTALKVSDDEWTVIQPLLEKVIAKQREANRSAFGGGGRRGGPGGPGGGARPEGTGGPDAQGGGKPPGMPDFGRTPETADLQAALLADDTSTDTVKAKLQAVRDARKKAAADLEQARQDLSKVLTLKQEAALVLVGILE